VTVGALDVAVVLLTTGTATAVVLREVIAYDRPAAPPAPPAPLPTVAAPVPVPVALEPLPELVHVPEPAPTSILSGLASLEHDEHTAMRRVASAVVLLALTLIAAGLVGGGIYRLVSGLK
jgi:hypothetical protein